MISTMKETVIRGNWGIKCKYRGIRRPLGLLSWKLVNFISGSSAPVQGRQAEREGKARGREGESEGRTVREAGRQSTYSFSHTNLAEIQWKELLKKQTVLETIVHYRPI